MGVTHFSGVTNATQGTTLGSYIAPDPSICHTWFDDFDDYTAGEWTITEAGTGTRAVGNLDGGVLVVTNGASDDNANFLQWSGNTAAATVETFKWEAARSMWFKARCKISDATQSDFVMGLQITDTSPLAVTDGLYFLKADGSTTLTFYATKDSTSSTVTAATLANDTYFTIGFFWNAALAKMQVFYNDTVVGEITSTTNMPDDEELTISFGIQNGEAAAKVLSLDYLLVSKMRNALTA